MIEKPSLFPVAYIPQDESRPRQQALANMASNSITPALPPPPGQTSNFANPVSCGTKFIVVHCVFLPLAIVAVIVRTWTRLFIVRSFRVDDCTWLQVSGLFVLTASVDPFFFFSFFLIRFDDYSPGTKCLCYYFLQQCVRDVAVSNEETVSTGIFQMLSIVLSGVTLSSKLFRWACSSENQASIF